MIHKADPSLGLCDSAARSQTIAFALAAALLAALPAAAQAPRPNLASHKVCKATSVEGQLTPDKAVDGPKSQASRWGSDYGTDMNKDSAWIFVDLGKTYQIDSLAIYWEHSGAKRYSVQTWKSRVDTPSYDDTGWETVFTDTTLAYQPRPVDMCLSFIKLAPVATRYVRIRCYKRLFEFGYSIMELEVYGEEGTLGLADRAHAGKGLAAVRGFDGTWLYRRKGGPAAVTPEAAAIRPGYRDGMGRLRPSRN